MAVYIYVCKECGYEFETTHSMMIDPYVHCPRCKKRGLVRRITGGSGFVKVPGGASPGAAGGIPEKEDLPRIKESVLKRADQTSKE
jgi:putative FmdB family regulatory protein